MDSSPFSHLRLSLRTAFSHRRSSTLSGSSTTTSPSSSPPSSVRGSYYRTRSRSPFTLHSPRSAQRSPVMLRRRPSAIDLALEAEQQSKGVESVGLGLMEPRPVVPVAIGAQDIFGSDSPTRQPFVMGGIFEVMEGSA